MRPGRARAQAAPGPARKRVARVAALASPPASSGRRKRRWSIAQVVRWSVPDPALIPRSMCVFPARRAGSDMFPTRTVRRPAETSGPRSLLASARHEAPKRSSRRRRGLRGVRRRRPPVPGQLLEGVGRRSVARVISRLSPPAGHRRAAPAPGFSRSRACQALDSEPILLEF